MYAKKSQMSKSQQILNLYSSIMQPASSHKQNKSDNDIRKKLGAILLQNQKVTSPYQKSIQRRLNKSDKQRESSQKVLLQSIRIKNSKPQAQDSDEEPSKQRMKLVYSINSSCQLPNSTSGLQYQTTTVTEQRNEDNLTSVLQRTQRLLKEYQRLLQQADCEKKQLELEVQYWKSKSGY